MNMILCIPTDFSIPITWSDIINVVYTLITLGALIAAIVANCKSSASIKNSLKMQEQSKNIELFDRRIALIDEIKVHNSTNVLHLVLLFNESIKKEYDCFNALLQGLASAHHDMNEYEEMLSHMDGADLYSTPFDQMADAESILSEHDYPADKVAEFEALCQSYEITKIEKSEGSELKIYNYAELSERISSAQVKLDAQKAKLIKMMQVFVQDSISPVTRK